MSRIKYLVVAVLCLWSSVSYAKTDIEFILDLSGSMRKATGGQAQIDSARAALFESLAGIPTGTLVAIRAYGHRIEQTDKAKSCTDTELIIPFGPVNIEAIKTKVNALSPKGYTPIAYSLQQAPADFSKEREAEKVIILLSDGEETCDGDPVATLEKLKEQGFKVVVHTVGFNVDSKTRQQLEAIAKAGGGNYYDAQGAAALNEALKAATQESLVIEKEKKTYGKEIRGGDTYESAVPLELDVEYKLDHHQKLSFFDYFYIDLEPGKELVIEMHTLEKGINLRGETPRETGMPYAGFQFHGDNRNVIKKVNIIGKQHGVERFQFNPAKAGRYYLLIGSTYDDMNKDHVTFKISMTTRGDLDGEKDAGNSLTEAMPMQPKRYSKNHIGSGDTTDVFTFEAKKDDTFFVGLIPNEDYGSWFKIAIFDSYKQKVMSQSSGMNEGLRSKNFTIPEDGTYYLQVELGGTVQKPVSYTLELKNPSGSASTSTKTEAPAKPAAKQATVPVARPAAKPAPATLGPTKPETTKAAPAQAVDPDAPLARPSTTKPPPAPAPPKPAP